MTQNNNSIAELEKRLWNAADQLRANSALTAQEYSRPVLGLIFLKYADHRFAEAEKGKACTGLEEETTDKGWGKAHNRENLRPVTGSIYNRHL